jgi:hypothetical protein
MLHRDTGATVFAVYGRWGLGKSTFMKLVEKEMLAASAAEQAEQAEQNDRQLRAWAALLVRAWRLLQQALQWVVYASQAVWVWLCTCAYALVWRPQAPENQQADTALLPGASIRQIVRRIEGDMDSTDAAIRAAAFARCRKIARPRVITVWFNAW